jgi:hypothetical protein
MSSNRVTSTAKRTTSTATRTRSTATRIRSTATRIRSTATRTRSTATRIRRPVAAVGIVAILAVSCAEPDLAESAPPPSETEDVLSEPALDPARDTLIESLATLTDTLVEAQAELDAAADADGSAADARASANAALELLLDDPDRVSPGEPSLFPARTTERDEPADRDDLLSTTLTAAREAGGTLGRATVEVLREPVGGDLGAWEQDAEGVVANAAAAVQDARSTDAVAEEVLALPADGLRALAWTLLATGTEEPDVTRDAAALASAHLAVVLVGLGLLDTTEGAVDPADEQAAGASDGAAATAGVAGADA